MSSGDQPPPSKRQKTSSITEVYVIEKSPFTRAPYIFNIPSDIDLYVYKELLLLYNLNPSNPLPKEIYKDFLNKIRDEWDLLFTTRLTKISSRFSDDFSFLSNSIITSMLSISIKDLYLKTSLEDFRGTDLMYMDYGIRKSVIEALKFYSLYIMKAIQQDYMKAIGLYNFTEAKQTKFVLSKLLVEDFYTFKCFSSMFINLYCEIQPLTSISSIPIIDDNYRLNNYNGVRDYRMRVFNLFKDTIHYSEDEELFSESLFQFIPTDRDLNLNGDFTEEMLLYLTSTFSINHCVSVLPDANFGENMFYYEDPIEYDSVIIRKTGSYRLHRIMNVSLIADRLCTTSRILYQMKSSSNFPKTKFIHTLNTSSTIYQNSLFVKYKYSMLPSIIKNNTLLIEIPLSTYIKNPNTLKVHQVSIGGRIESNQIIKFFNAIFLTTKDSSIINPTGSGNIKKELYRQYIEINHYWKMLSLLEQPYYKSASYARVKKTIIENGITIELDEPLMY